MNVYKSGAFLQQCFSVHPLSLDLKMVTPPELIGVACTNCRMRHRLTIQRVISQPQENSEAGNNTLLLLQKCFHAHPEDIRICTVHIEHQNIEFRCQPCRRTYKLNVVLFETRQS